MKGYKKLNISISVIIPVYNSISFIKGCLNSLIRQDYSLLEFIVVDDGSTDGSGAVCDEFARQDKRFHIYHQLNQGIAAARNSGLKHVHGEYIAWVDADDYISENWIQSVVKAIEKNHPDCLLFDYSTLDSYGMTPVYYATSSQFIKQDIYVYELSCDDKIHSHLWRHVIKKSIWDHCSFSKNIHVMEDYQVLTKLAIYMENIYYLHPVSSNM